MTYLLGKYISTTVRKFLCKITQLYFFDFWDVADVWHVDPLKYLINIYNFCNHVVDIYIAEFWMVAIGWYLFFCGVRWVYLFSTEGDEVSLDISGIHAPTSLLVLL
jgi:hypothetical protein